MEKIIKSLRVFTSFVILLLALSLQSACNNQKNASCLSEIEHADSVANETDSIIVLSDSLLNALQDSTEYLSMRLNDDRVVYAEISKHNFQDNLFCIVRDNILVDSFRVGSNGWIYGIYKSRNDNIIYVLSVGGTGRQAFIGKLNLKTKIQKFVKYDAYGFCDLIDGKNKYIIQCKTNPMHSEEMISYQWTDTVDRNFKFINSSDTTEVICE